MQMHYCPMTGEQQEGIATVVLTPQDLLIFPSRYAAVPQDMATSLPGNIANHQEPALSGYQYALRQMRQGYVYLYYDQHPDGSDHQWDIYSVDANGELTLININTLHTQTPTHHAVEPSDTYSKTRATRHHLARVF